LDKHVGRILTRVSRFRDVHGDPMLLALSLGRFRRRAGKVDELGRFLEPLVPIVSPYAYAHGANGDCFFRQFCTVLVGQLSRRDFHRPEVAKGVEGELDVTFLAQADRCG